jgi:peptidoglycan/xylan/chitin deacetylase (PgdA/CDA1 family)
MSPLRPRSRRRDPPMGSAILRRWLLRSVKAAAAAVDGLRPPPPGAVMLLYHRVGGGAPIELDLPSPVFEEQVAVLASTGRVRRLAEVLDGGCHRPADAHTVVVTFDDGTADFIEHALPVLERYRVPVTYYVATAHVEEQRPFPHGGTPMTWEGLREAVSTGLVEVGSHTHRHVLLDRAEDVDGELDRSIGLIEERLGVTPEDFAYPKAVPGSPAAEGAVRERFRSAALAGNRPNIYGLTDPHRLTRSPVQASDGMCFFRHKVAGGLWLEGDIRNAVNRVRYVRSSS